MDNLDFNFFCSSCKKCGEYRRENCFTSYRIKRYKSGDYLAFKGDKVKELSLLVSGSITVSFVLASGVVIRSTKHNAPYPIGALALLGKENRYRVEVIADQDCEAILVRRDEIERLIMSCRDFMLSFFDYSTSKLDVIVEHLALLSQRSITAKVAYYIFICSKDGIHFKFTKPIGRLAEYLCIERPSLSRVISNLAANGIISHKNGEGKILDVTRLKEFVE